MFAQTAAEGPLTAAELQALLVDLLIGAADGLPDRWARLLGPVEQRPASENGNSNWHVNPTATGDELRAIRTVVDLVRKQHPYVDVEFTAH